MPLVSTRALVLQAFPYSETSKVLRLFTADHGVRTVIAKGALRPRSSFGGLLEPFTEGVATFFLKEGRELHTLRGFDLVQSRQGLGRDLIAFAGASLLAELTLRFGTEEPHPALYQLLHDAWDALLTAPPEQLEPAVFTGAWTLIAELGFAPNARSCVGCARVLGEEESARFDSGAGGVSCTRCRPAGRILPSAARHELASMVEGSVPTGFTGGSGVHRALLRGFVDAQLASDRGLRSLDLLLQLRPDVAQVDRAASDDATVPGVA